MPLNWKTFCTEPALRVEEDKVRVVIETGRQQVIEVTATDDQIYLRSVIAKPAAVARFENAVLRAWQRNRTVSLVSFRVDEKDRLVGESWFPTIGLTREEFQIHLRTVAIECDRFEFQITGKDVE
jgi:hypothetical protein